jgi:hypothetical protein
MGRLLCVYLLCLLLPQQKNTDTRHQLTLALNSGKTTDSLYNSLKIIKNKSPLTISYMGVLEALKAKHAWNPYSKLKYINRSEKTLEQAVAGDQHNLEIRFMRFSVEHNVPGFLGDNKHLVADREEMIQQLKNERYDPDDKTFIITVIRFLLNSKRCIPAENSYLTKALIRLQ